MSLKNIVLTKWPRFVITIILVQLTIGLSAQSKFNFDKILLKKPAEIVDFADSLSLSNRSEEAIELIKLALNQNLIKKNPRHLAVLYQELGDCYSDNQEARNSFSAYLNANKYIRLIKDTSLLIRNYIMMSSSYASIEENDTAFYLLEKARVIAENNPKKYGKPLKTIYNNLGLIYFNKINYTEALRLFYKSIDYTDKINDRKGLAKTYNNIGNLYAELRQPDKSLEYYKKSLETDYTSDILGNIGIHYLEQKLYDSALKYTNKSIAMDLKSDDLAGLAANYTVVGNLYKKRSMIDSAMLYYTLSSNLAREIEDSSVIENNDYNIVSLLIEQKKYDQARKLGVKNLNSLLRGDDLDFIADAYGQLMEISNKLGDYKMAFKYQGEYILYKDSARMANKTLEIKNLELNAEYKRKSSNDSLLHAQATLLNNVQHDSEIKKQRLILFGFLVVLLIVAIFSILVFKRYKVSQRQKEIINLQKNEMYHQKLVVEEKQKEILDSIHYAKRIQYALIAHKDFIDENLPENFVYFNPKDIVSGDFYWATKTDNFFYLAICDSTGHGVPGAFMSLLNIGFLSEAINEKGILEPNKVFDFVRMRLENSISKEGQKDGFDGILLRYDLKTKKMDYAAANNAPVIVSNGVFTELPKDRMPVGVGERKNDFTLFSIDAQSGDKLFFYTDGFADQFGGPKGKKYKYKKLNDLLTNTTLPLNQLSPFLSDEFQAWKGELEQVDDVCIIGLKI